MKFTRTILSCTVATFILGATGTIADEPTKRGLEFLEKTGWFKSSTPIQELRENSTTSFDLLDENDSGSITIDEIYMPQNDKDLSQLDPTELAENRQKQRVIQNKFMNWSEEIEEFKVVDTNNDGYWSEAEFEARTDNLNRHRLELGIAQWDKDGNNAVELHEFNSHLDELESLDEDGDGTVSREEAFKSQNSQVITDVLLQQLQSDAIVFRGQGMDSLGGLRGTRTLPGSAVQTGVRIIHRTKPEERKAN